ncbi:MAG: hypothetical protein ACFFDN_39580 [Candidatus Hodarchaeota archaeon]
MQLYLVSDKGELIKLNKLDFAENDVYLIDDETSIYLWIGLKVSLNKKDLTVRIARNLNKERGGMAKILLMDQNREYGSFLTMMQILTERSLQNNIIEQRPEQILKNHMNLHNPHNPPNPPNPGSNEETGIEANLTKWLKQLKKYRKSEQEKIAPEPRERSDEELKEMIRVAAYFISQNQLSYNELCWMLAEKQLIIQKGDDNVTKDDIQKKAEEIFRSSCTYDELCWLIAELKILTEEKYLEIG